MKKVLSLCCIAAIAILIVCASACAEGVLVENWETHSVSELIEARKLLDEKITELQKPRDASINNESTSESLSDGIILFSNEDATITWMGLEDTHTSGLDFRPNLYIENNSSSELSIRPNSFYVNGYLMSASNSGAIKLEPFTKLMLSTKNSWNLSAEDLIDVYGCGTIDNVTIKLTIKVGDKTLVDDQKYSIDTNIDIFDLMGTNSYFTRKYPRGTTPPIIDYSSQPIVFENEEISIFWCGLSDTHTSGMDFRPNLYLENNSSDVLSVRPSSFYVNGFLMSASNSGAIELEPQSKFMLSTRNSWNLSAGDLIDVYGCSTIDSFTVYLTIKVGSKTIADEYVYNVDANIDIFDLMGTNSYFTNKYPAGFLPQTLDFSSMYVLFENNDARILWNGLEDTHTSGLDFRPNIYIENNSNEKLSVRPESFYVNNYLMSGSNTGAIVLEPHTKIMLVTRNSWNYSAEDLIDVYNCTTIDNVTINLTIKLGNSVLEDNKKHSIDTNIDIYELMGTNSYFTKKYPPTK
jgi:hypothetical protein